MAKIPLRTYIHDIEVLIDHGQIDEAIAHCRYIIQTFPKLVSAYRMLGKAYLEGKRYSDAADIFQRVLSSVPDDYVSHIGMSIIREDESNLNAAIWHMERAFEIQPYNASIQNELRRQYGRRDGLQPPKVRLTRGALARMYAKGNLYQQAIGELRAAIAEDPQRVDLQALLARMYLMTGQRVEAVETCSLILKKFPYCLEASRILAIILPETGRKDDAKAYKQRIGDLDPYLLHAAPQAPNSDSVPENMVTVEHLDYRITGGPALPASSQPAWAASLGVSIEDFTPAKEEAIPSWLASEGEVIPLEGIDAYRGPETPPFVGFTADTLETTHAPSPLDQITGGVSEEDDQPIPDWMKEAGWQPGSGTEEQPSIEFEQPEGELAKAELPDWLQSIAPAEIEGESAQKVEEPAGEAVLPWLQESPPGPTDTIISWLGEKKEEISKPSKTPIEPSPIQAEAELPDWLRDISSTVPAEPEATAEGVVEKAELPEWLVTPIEEVPSEAPSAALEDVSAISEETATPVEALPDWLVSQGTETVPEIQQAGEGPGEILTAIPEVSLEERAEEFPVEVPAETAAVEERSSWEQGLGEEIPAESQPAVLETIPEASPAEGIPDWLRDLAQGIPAEETTIPIQEEVEVSHKTGITDWLKSLETTPEEVQAAPEPIEIAPIQEIPEITKTEEPIEAEEVPPEELPIWLPSVEEAPSEVQPVIEETTVAPVEGTALPGEEIPDWLQAMQAEAPEEVEEAPAEAIAETPAYTVSETPEAVISDQDAALAWLESLAAKQGIPEEELLTKPEERPEAPPVWAQEGGVEAAQLEKAIEEIPAPVEEQPALEAVLPAWLAEEFAPLEVPEEPTQIGIVEEILTAEITPEEAPAVQAPGYSLEDQDAALAWLESLAQKQGIPEEELITSPEERIETPPAWVKGRETGEVTPAPTLAPEEVLPIFPAEEEALPVKPVEEVVPAGEMPDWLKEIALPAEEEEEIPTQPVRVSEEAPAVPSDAGKEEAPAWVPEEAPVETLTPTEEAVPETTLTDQEAALAWLESLAARQGVPEGELLTKPEERLEAPPTWVKEEIPSEIPITEEPVVPAEEEAAFFEEIAPAPSEIEAPEWIAEGPVEEVEEYPAWQPAEAIPTAPEMMGAEQAPLAEATPIEEVTPAKLVEVLPPEITPEELLDINTASLVELERVPGIGFIRAQNILNYRESRGSLTSLNDLTNIPDFYPAMVDDLRSFVTVKVAKPEAIPPSEVKLPLPEGQLLGAVRTVLAHGGLPEILSQYAQLIKQRTQLDEVISDLHKVVSQYPQDANAWQILGDAYMRNNQLSEAFDAYNQAENCL